MSRSHLLIFPGLLQIALVSCSSNKAPTAPVPFRAEVAGYQIEFPMSARRLIEKGYLINRKLGSQYVNFTETTKEAWLMDVYGGNGELLHGLPDARSAYGVNIYLKHKGYQLDSVRTALETQFGKQFEPVLTTHRPTIWPVDKAGYKLVLNPSTTLFLRRATGWQGDPWDQYDTLRIAIGYNLSEEQQEYFAISADGIADDD